MAGLSRSGPAPVADLEETSDARADIPPAGPGRTGPDARSDGAGPGGQPRGHRAAKPDLSTSPGDPGAARPGLPRRRRLCWAATARLPLAAVRRHRDAVADPGG